LVGRKNYQITITETSSQDSKDWPLEIISDGSDVDAGNGPASPKHTKYFWIKAP